MKKNILISLVTIVSGGDVIFSNFEVELGSEFEII